MKLIFQITMALHLLVNMSCMREEEFLVRDHSVVLISSNSLSLEKCSQIIVDRDGYVYCIAVIFNSSLDSPDYLNKDSVIIKVNPYGEVMWMTKIGGKHSGAGDDTCSSLTTDVEGNVYCGGSTSGYLGESAASGSDAFIVKLNSSGELMWITQLGAKTKIIGYNNDGEDYCERIAVDREQNVFCAGTTTGNMALHREDSDVNSMVFKLDSNGQLAWVRQIDMKHYAVLEKSQECTRIGVDIQGNLSCTENQSNMFVHYDLQGNLIWMTQFTRHLNILDNEECTSLIIDQDGQSHCRA